MGKKFVVMIVLLAFMGLMLIGCVSNKEASSEPPQPQETPKEPVYLDVLQNSYSLSDSAISYTIFNNTGEDIAVRLSPKLERKVGDSWEAVPLDGIGFCGNPDRVEKTFSYEVPLEWFGNSLTAGEYKLSLERLKSDRDFDLKEVLSDTFAFVDNEEERSSGQIKMSVKPDTLTPSGASFILENTTEIEFMYGDPYGLERKNGDAWEKMDTISGDIAFFAIGHMLEGNQTDEITVDWWPYGELTAGEYRIVKGYSVVRAPGDYDSYEMSAEFTIDEVQ